MTTSARSGTPPASPCERAHRGDGKEPERAECHSPASLVELRAEGQLDALGAGGEWHRDQAVVPVPAWGLQPALGAGGEWHRDQAVVPTQARGGPAVRGRLPVGIPVLRDEQVAG